MNKNKNKNRQNTYFSLLTKITVTLFLCCAFLIGKLGFQLLGTLPDSGQSDLGNVFSQTSQAKNSQPEASASISPETDWELILVNRSNPIPKGYDVKLTQLRNNQSVDSRIYPSLQKMFDDMRAAGLTPVISSSYRTAEKQQSLLDEKIADYQKEGHSDKEAEKLAKAWVAVPGTSEHQLGMAVDITSTDRNSQNPSIIWEWLMKNSYKYGFILRYPENKEEITNTIYEPWHYRYVGKTAAKEIYERQICLEEYLQ